MKEILILFGSVTILLLFYIAANPSIQTKRIEQFETAVQKHDMVVMSALYKSIINSSKNHDLCMVALYQDSLDIKIPLKLVRKDCQ